MSEADMSLGMRISPKNPPASSSGAASGTSSRLSVDSFPGLPGLSGTAGCEVPPAVEASSPRDSGTSSEPSLEAPSSAVLGGSAAASSTTVLCGSAAPTSARLSGSTRPAGPVTKAASATPSCVSAFKDACGSSQGAMPGSGCGSPPTGPSEGDCSASGATFASLPPPSAATFSLSPPAFARETSPLTARRLRAAAVAATSRHMPATVPKPGRTKDMPWRRCRAPTMPAPLAASMPAVATPFAARFTPDLILVLEFVSTSSILSRFFSKNGEMNHR
mmetsp:Transcript_41394/g.119114  ORF Transcript_41394/g.119114 Transcript_41394/m.119114 type:complete len:276 (-) Transcript_41394:837-1664(-)